MTDLSDDKLVARATAQAIRTCATLFNEAVIRTSAIHNFERCQLFSEIRDIFDKQATEFERVATLSQREPHRQTVSPPDAPARTGGFLCGNCNRVVQSGCDKKDCIYWAAPSPTTPGHQLAQRLRSFVTKSGGVDADPQGILDAADALDQMQREIATLRANYQEAWNARFDGITRAETAERSLAEANAAEKDAIELAALHLSSVDRLNAELKIAEERASRLQAQVEEAAPIISAVKAWRAVELEDGCYADATLKALGNVRASLSPASTSSDLVAVQREKLSRLLDWMREETENQTCSQVCDATYEMRGCHGPCALEKGKEFLREFRAALNDPGRTG